MSNPILTPTGGHNGVLQDARSCHSPLRPVIVISTTHGGLSDKDDIYSEDFASTIVVQVPAGITLETAISLSLERTVYGREPYVGPLVRF